MGKSISNRPKRSTPAHFLTLLLVTAKHIATNRGEAHSGTQLYHHAEFHTDWRHRR